MDRSKQTPVPRGQAEGARGEGQGPLEPSVQDLLWTIILDEPRCRVLPGRRPLFQAPRGRERR